MAKNDSFIEIGFDFRLIHLVGVKEEKNEYLEHMFLIKEDCFLQKLNQALKSKIVEEKTDDDFKISIEKAPKFYQKLKRCKTKPIIVTTENDWDFVVIELDEIQRIEKIMDEGFVLVRLERIDEDNFIYFSFKGKEIIKELQNKVDILVVD